MVSTLLKITIGKCPICSKDADSSHHIKPLADGGDDCQRNKVLLCRSCHNLIEQIYGETGMMFCPALVQIIQIKYDFPLTHQFKRVCHRKILKGSQPKSKTHQYSDAFTVCNRCGIGFYRDDTRQIYCDLCCEILIAKASKAEGLTR